MIWIWSFDGIKTVVFVYKLSRVPRARSLEITRTRQLLIHASEYNVNKFTKPYLEKIEILLCETAASKWPPQLKLQEVLFRNGNSRKVLISSIKMFISLSLSENPAKTYIPVGWSAVKITNWKRWIRFLTGEFIAGQKFLKSPGKKTREIK